MLPALLNQLDGDQPFCNQPTDLPPRAQRPALTWIQTGLALTAVVATTLPFNQYNWPTPQQRPLVRENRTYILDTPLQLIGQDAIPPQRFQYDYPVPKQRPFSADNRTWIVSGLSLITPAVPATWTDLPPKGRPFPVANRTHIVQTPLLLIGQDAIPPNRFQYDYPVPGRKRPPDLTIAASGLALSSAFVQAPFYQTEWPITRRLRGSQGWVSASLDIASIAPFAQSDWPVPARRRHRDASVVNASLDIGAVVPFRQNDWPIPPRNPAQSGATWISPPLLLENVPAAYFLVAEAGEFGVSGQDVTLTYTPAVEDTSGHRAGWPPAYTKEQLEQFLEKRRPKPAQEDTPAAVQVVQVSPLVEPVVQPKIGPLGPLGAVGQAVAGDPEPVDDSAVVAMVAALEQALADEAEDEETAIQVILGLI